MMPLMLYSGLEHIYKIHDEEADGKVNRQSWSVVQIKGETK